MNAEQLALSNCDREPVHIPGRIQSFGALVAFDMQSEEIQHYSDNWARLFKSLPQIELGTTLGTALDDSMLSHAIRNSLSMPSIAKRRERLGTVDFAGQRADVCVFRSGNLGVIELEHDVEDAVARHSPVSMVQEMLATLRTDSLAAVLESSVEQLRKLTGVDRVMAYHFLENRDGEVVAEARSPSVSPFLGLRYPASDIPRPAQELMLRMPFRIIADVADPHSQLQSLENSAPLDLSLSHLRGVSPIHVEYLQNMGVRSTMNTSLIVNSELWGLFAFHHYRPLRLSSDRRAICELFGTMVSSIIQQKLEEELLSSRSRISSALKVLRKSTKQSIEQVFAESVEPILLEIEAEGAALVDGQSLVAVGNTPSDDVIHGLCQKSLTEKVSTDCMRDSVDASELGDVAGAHVLDFDETAPSFLLFFRREVLTKVRWAGSQEKRLEIGANGPRLHPRASFEEYVEAVSGRSKAWSQADRVALLDFREALRDAAQSLSDSPARIEWMKQKQQQDLMIAELNHRVKNILALVLSIARQTKATATSLEEYTQAIESRLLTLSKAHDIVIASGHQWVSIERLLSTDLQPFLGSNIEVEMQGPPMAVRSDSAPVLALVFHEMTVNAVKYGALSERGRELRITWSEESGGLALEWDETLNAGLAAPESIGFGQSLIKRAIPHQCGGECDFEFKENGVRLKIWLPSDVITKTQTQSVSNASPATQIANHDAQLFGECEQSVLLLEDNFILAAEIENFLTGMGASKIDCFGSLERCRDEFCDDLLPDLAILDIHIGQENSLEFAGQLYRAGVPIIFISGYDASLELPESLAHCPVLRKPVQEVKLQRVIREIRGIRNEKSADT